jgi:hypothetical protein
MPRLCWNNVYANAQVGKRLFASTTILGYCSPWKLPSWWNPKRHILGPNSVKLCLICRSRLPGSGCAYLQKKSEKGLPVGNLSHAGGANPEPTLMNSNIHGDFVDVINWARFGFDRFQGFRSARSWKSWPIATLTQFCPIRVMPFRAGTSFDMAISNMAAISFQNACLLFIFIILLISLKV